MFENVLKGTRVRKGTRMKRGGVKKWKTFGGKDASRWKKEGSTASMMRLTRKVR